MRSILGYCFLLLGSRSTHQSLAPHQLSTSSSQVPSCPLSIIIIFTNSISPRILSPTFSRDRGLVHHHHLHSFISSSCQAITIFISNTTTSSLPLSTLLLLSKMLWLLLPLALLARSLHHLLCSARPFPLLLYACFPLEITAAFLPPLFCLSLLLQLRLVLILQLCSFFFIGLL